MKLDTDLRGSIAEQVLVALRDVAAGSVADLRGSLAENRADEFSDVDVLWDVPDGTFLQSVHGVGDVLSKVRPVESLRSDPDFQNSDKRRLIFVQFESMPLFWRVDIEVFARSIQRDRSYDLRNEAARGSDWSPTHSALMNAVAAIKALLRNETDEASSLLERAYRRVGLPVPNLQPQRATVELVDEIVVIDPEVRVLGDRVRCLYREAFKWEGSDV